VGPRAGLGAVECTTEGQTCRQRDRSTHSRFGLSLNRVGCGSLNRKVSVIFMPSDSSFCSRFTDCLRCEPCTLARLETGSAAPLRWESVTGAGVKFAHKQARNENLENGRAAPLHWESVTGAGAKPEWEQKL
jgi:hypothetical protein